MRVCVVLDTRFVRSPDGTIWGESAASYENWMRYLSVFSQVKVIARVSSVAEDTAGLARCDGEGVVFVDIPAYRGFFGFLKSLNATKRRVSSAIGAGDSVILRAPSPLASIAYRILRRRRQPYAVEVVGDPFDVFAPKAIRHVLRPLLRFVMTRNLQHECAGAGWASYVTASSLQQRYPASSAVITTHYSSVRIPEDAFRPTPRAISPLLGSVALITIGSLAQPYKGVDILLNAIRLLQDEGLECSLSIVGDGAYRHSLEAQARQLEIQGQVRFLGRIVSPEAIRPLLDSADIFVLASRAEGLPRVVIEAMARAMPCVCSDVGGIGELLPEEDLFHSGDAADLARKLALVARDPERLQKMSQRNLITSLQYEESALQLRREEFYRAIRYDTSTCEGLTR